MAHFLFSLSYIHFIYLFFLIIICVLTQANLLLTLFEIANLF